jgi:hypothetical protein
MSDLDAKTQRLLDAFSQSYLLEPLFRFPDLFLRRMFGGLAVYRSDLLILVLMEGGEEDRTWKGQTFDYGIWNGLLLPTSRDRQPALIADFPSLQPHPVLPKWLYLPMRDPKYEEIADQLISLIGKEDSRIGVEGNTRARRSKRVKTKISRK